MSSSYLSESSLLVYIDLSCPCDTSKCCLQCDAIVVIHNTICCLSLAPLIKLSSTADTRSRCPPYIKLLAWKCISTMFSWKSVKYSSAFG